MIESVIKFHANILGWFPELSWGKQIATYGINIKNW